MGEHRFVQSTGVYTYMAALCAEAERSGQLELDLDQLRLERAAASVLTTGLVGTLGDVTVVVRATRNAAARLAQSGIAFALANRSGAYRLEVPTEEEKKLALNTWRYAWMPASVESSRGLFSPEGGFQPELFSAGELGESEIVPSKYQRYFAAFINPHIVGVPDEPTPLLDTVRPWLAKVIPGALAREGLGGWDRSQLDDIGVIVEELVDNVRQHAAPFGKEIKSLVQVAVTQSGGTLRVHVAVSDNGVGIVRTLRAKLEAERDLPSLDAQLMTDLFSGRLGRWHRGRGHGLVEIAKRVQEVPCSEIFVATGTTYLRAQSSTGTNFVPVPSGNSFSLKGTVLTISLPLVAKKGNRQ